MLNDILELQNNLYYTIKYYQEKFLILFNKIINNKTGEIFTKKYVDNYFIFTNNNYNIIFYNNKWILTHNNIYIGDNDNLIEIINHYLLLNNRLSLCLHSQSMDIDMEEINNLLHNIKI